MSINKTLNNPAAGLDEEFTDFVNGHSAALADGDVIVLKLASITTTAQAQEGTSSTTAGDNTILGVVHDPLGQGVAVGARGVAMLKGYKRVKYGTTAVSAGTTTQLKQSGTGLTAMKISAGTSMLPGSIIGSIVGSKTTAQTTVPAYIDIR